MNLEDALFKLGLRADLCHDPVVHAVELVDKIVDVRRVLALDLVDMVNKLEGVNVTEHLVVMEGGKTGQLIGLHVKEGTLRPAELGRSGNLVLSALLPDEEAAVQGDLADQGHLISFDHPHAAV